MAKDKKWIQNANLKEGAFTKKAKKAGYGVQTYASRVLKNPEKYPEEILQIQKKLGIDIGMKGGGLAKILEV